MTPNKKSQEIRNVCCECGATANALTCLQKYGVPPEQISFSLSTWHQGKCDYCGYKKSVTEVRDFFYPDFSLIKKVAKLLKTIKL